MTEEDLRNRIVEIEKKEALTEQKVASLEKKLEILSSGINRGLWILGGGFISAIVAWIAGGGLAK